MWFSKFPCSLFSQISLVPKTYLPMFPCSLKINGHVPLSPPTPPPLLQPWESLIVHTSISNKWGPPGGGGVPVLLKKSAFSLVPQNRNLGFSMFPVPQNCICSPVPFSFRLLFPCSSEINGLIPLFPKTLGRASRMYRIPKCRPTKLPPTSYMYMANEALKTEHALLWWRTLDKRQREFRHLCLDSRTSRFKFPLILFSRFYKWSNTCDIVWFLSSDYMMSANDWGFGYQTSIAFCCFFSMWIPPHTEHILLCTCITSYGDKCI